MSKLLFLVLTVVFFTPCIWANDVENLQKIITQFKIVNIRSINKDVVNYQIVNNPSEFKQLVVSDYTISDSKSFIKVRVSKYCQLSLDTGATNKLGSLCRDIKIEVLKGSSQCCLTIPKGLNLISSHLSNFLYILKEIKTTANQINNFHISKYEFDKIFKDELSGKNESAQIKLGYILSDGSYLYQISGEQFCTNSSCNPLKISSVVKLAMNGNLEVFTDDVTSSTKTFNAIRRSEAMQICERAYGNDHFFSKCVFNKTEILKKQNEKDCSTNIFKFKSISYRDCFKTCLSFDNDPYYKICYWGGRAIHKKDAFQYQGFLVDSNFAKCIKDSKITYLSADPEIRDPFKNKCLYVGKKRLIILDRAYVNITVDNVEVDSVTAVKMCQNAKVCFWGSIRIK